MTPFSITLHWFPSSVLMQGVLSTLKWMCPCYLLPVKQGYLFILPMFSKRKAHFCSPCSETKSMRILWISLFPFFSPFSSESGMTYLREKFGRKKAKRAWLRPRVAFFTAQLPAWSVHSFLLFILWVGSWEQLLGHPCWGICSYPVKPDSFS